MSRGKTYTVTKEFLMGALLLIIIGFLVLCGEDPKDLF